MGKKTWTDEQIEFVVECRNKNHTARETIDLVREKFKIWPTRNAIIALLNRYKAKPAVPRRKPPPDKKLPDLKPIESDILFRDSLPHHCRYMTQAGANSPICGRDIVKGSYCEEHHALCLRKVRDGKEIEDGI